MAGPPKVIIHPRLNFAMSQQHVSCSHTNTTMIRLLLERIVVLEHLPLVEVIGTIRPMSRIRQQIGQQGVLSRDREQHIEVQQKGGL